MSKFCVNCGNEIANGMAFCSGCSAKVETTENTVTKVETNVAQVTTVKEAKEQNVLSPPSKTSSIESSNIEPTGKYGVVSTGYFFGMMLLYAIPVLGWLICLITAFASKNENKKHFARAILIWLILGAILSVSLFFLFSWLGDVIKNLIGEFSGELGIFNNLQDLSGLGNLGMSGDIGNLEGLQDIQTNGNLEGIENLESIFEQFKQYENIPIE